MAPEIAEGLELTRGERIMYPLALLIQGHGQSAIRVAGDGADMRVHGVTDRQQVNVHL